MPYLDKEQEKARNRAKYHRNKEKYLARGRLMSIALLG
jgi:hypothetical protein